jgi:poly-gamma-glutamate capsule biosynthesis protein CapA/YwtB (metallophosphatase superfamily)
VNRVLFVSFLGALAAASHAAGAVVKVTSTLPEWLAPEGRLVVTGWAAPSERVTLRSQSGALARVWAGPRGGFRLKGHVTETGRNRLSLVASGIETPLGVVPVRPLRLAAVGDVTFGNGVGRMIGLHGVRYPWVSVAPVLRRADIALANLEGAVSTRGTPVPNKEFHFRGPPGALSAAGRFAGVDVVSLANNHTLDYGPIAFLDTLRYARRYGIRTIGGGADLERSRRPTVVPLGGITVAFLGYSDVRPLGFDAGPGRPGTAPAFPELITADIRAARERADVVVIYFHWGIERTFFPTARQRSLARVSFAAGAHVVLGSHPHVQQPRERFGTRFVAWSLGNFVFGANSPGTERTGILRLALARYGVVGHGFRRARIVQYQPRLL